MMTYSSRPFKFRAWSSKPFDPYGKYPEGKMAHEWFSRHDTSDWIIKDEITLKELAQVDDNDHLMQFTGLHDRHGKPLFEGDVVWLEERMAEHVHYNGYLNGIFEVVFQWGCFCIRSLSREDDSPLNMVLYDYGYWETHESERGYYLEVIGHVHEPIEVLEERVKDKRSEGVSVQYS